MQWHLGWIIQVDLRILGDCLKCLRHFISIPWTQRIRTVYRSRKPQNVLQRSVSLPFAVLLLATTTSTSENVHSSSAWSKVVGGPTSFWLSWILWKQTSKWIHQYDHVFGEKAVILLKNKPYRHLHFSSLDNVKYKCPSLCSLLHWKCTININVACATKNLTNRYVLAYRKQLYEWGWRTGSRRSQKLQLVLVLWYRKTYSMAHNEKAVHNDCLRHINFSKRRMTAKTILERLTRPHTVSNRLCADCQEL